MNLTLFYFIFNKKKKQHVSSRDTFLTFLPTPVLTLILFFFIFLFFFSIKLMTNVIVTELAKYSRTDFIFSQLFDLCNNVGSLFFSYCISSFQDEIMVIGKQFFIFFPFFRKENVLTL